MTDNMTEPNPISDGIIQELLTTVKGLQAEMAELRSGATGGNNLPTDKSGHATLPVGSDVRGNPRKRQLPGEEADLSDAENPISDEDEGAPPLVFLKKAMPLSRRPLSQDWMMIPGARKRRSSGFPTASG